MSVGNLGSIQRSLRPPNERDGTTINAQADRRIGCNRPGERYTAVPEMRADKHHAAGVCAGALVQEMKRQIAAKIVKDRT
jgi:hypothetical protein